MIMKHVKVYYRPLQVLLLVSSPEVLVPVKKY